MGFLDEASKKGIVSPPARDQTINSEELESTGICNILARKLREFIQIPSYFIDATCPIYMQECMHKVFLNGGVAFSLNFCPCPAELD